MTLYSARNCKAAANERANEVKRFYLIFQRIFKRFFVLIILLSLLANEQPISAKNGDEKFIDSLGEKAFLFLKENTDDNGFTIDSSGWPIGSIASSGFYLTSIPIAVERNWISKEEGYQRAMTTLNGYYDDPNDPSDFYVESEHGFFPHWFDQKTGKWNREDWYSSIDTSILISGMLTVGQYYAGTEVENVSEKLYENIDWAWMLNGDDVLSLGWRPDRGFHAAKWSGYNEGMLAVLLAMGSPTHPISEKCWDAWGRTYQNENYEHGNQAFEFVESTSTSLFTYQYPQIWFNLSGKKDRIGIDYFQNSINATLENRAYCMENPQKNKGYGPNAWGLTACECPRHSSNYGAHGPRQNDDGTIAPAGVGGSILFTPNESMQALLYMNDTYGENLWGKYGFKDAYNPSVNWFSSNYIGIDEGAMLAMIENYRSGLVQRLFMQNEYAIMAMKKAGFKEK
jgi:hypothetical protein